MLINILRPVTRPATIREFGGAGGKVWRVAETLRETLKKSRFPRPVATQDECWRVIYEVYNLGFKLQSSVDTDGHLSDDEVMVSFISTRELSKRPGKVMAKVSEEGPQVITQNGVPAAYIIPTSGRGIEADLDTLRRLLLGRALDAAQTEAARAGTSQMTMEEINEEIAAYRKERGAKQSNR